VVPVIAGVRAGVVGVISEGVTGLMAVREAPDDILRTTFGSADNCSSPDTGGACVGVSMPGSEGIVASECGGGIFGEDDERFSSLSTGRLLSEDIEDDVVSLRFLCLVCTFCPCLMLLAGRGRIAVVSERSASLSVTFRLLGFVRRSEASAVSSCGANASV
jgi:hypothetical protein